MDGLRVVLKRLDPALYKPPVKCDFCGHSENDELLYGKIHSLDNMNVHYYCLLFACNLQQNGDDNEGILGFLPNDIRIEIRRSQKDKCSYCSKPGATVICVQRMCKKVFHLPCGIKNGSIHHFFKNFQSFCKAHRPYQKVPQHQLMLPDAPICAICLEPVKRDPKCRSSVWAPCCKYNAWLHRNCIQKLALHAGYFFKCPRCNNNAEFSKAMLSCGIYIPDQDASWELEPNAFEDLHHRHSLCDAETCICPLGREHDVDDTEWEVILCDGCGSQGIHLGCLGAPPKSWRKWSCKVCIEILQKDNAPSSSARAVIEVPSCSTAGSVDSLTSDQQGGQLKREATEWLERYDGDVTAPQQVNDSLLPVQRGEQQQQRTAKRGKLLDELSKEKENEELASETHDGKDKQFPTIGRRQRDRRRSRGCGRGQQTIQVTKDERRPLHPNCLL